MNNFNRTEAQSKEPRKLCCMVTHDTLLECTNCSEEHAFICEDFQGENDDEIQSSNFIYDSCTKKLCKFSAFTETLVRHHHFDVKFKK